MNKISKLILALFVSSVFNDMNAMKSSLLIKLKKIAELHASVDKQELKKINKLFQDLHNKKILNPIIFFREHIEGINNQLCFAMINKNGKIIFTSRKNENIFFSEHSQIIGESYENLIALEDSTKVTIVLVNKNNLIQDLRNIK